MFSPNRSHERRQFRRSEPLLTDENNGRASSRRQREDLREISIKGDNHTRFASGAIKNLTVRRLAHSDFPGVDGIPAIVPQNRGRGRRAAPDQERCASCGIDLKINCAVDSGRCKREHLLEVFLLKIRIILEQL